MIRRPPRSALDLSSAASDVYKRQVLANVLARYARLGLRPVVAAELEFYLFERERNADGTPRHTQTASGGRALVRGQTLLPIHTSETKRPV